MWVYHLEKSKDKRVQPPQGLPQKKHGDVALSLVTPAKVSLAQKR